ncbi:MAG: 2-oxoglutarate dehydrogenase, E2 component, dihydrolipoamide succinyltransferase, partial [Acidobacteria bacterium]|nr:2-oxoglutarate dehydrogenase, E2 component, dihydrolipoamide succinyltransferase [Acidobacteriota bacterium]
MSVEVVMPQMGESITEGTVSKWLKAVGDKIEKDEAILEISTDKVDAEVPSPGAGVLLEIRHQEGETVEVGTVVAVIGQEGEEAAPREPHTWMDESESRASSSQASVPAEAATPAEVPTPEILTKEVSALDKSTSASATDSSSEPPTEVVMPQMGESITEGTVSKWLKSVGARIEKDEPLLEISTDKVDAEVPSPAAGTLLEIKVNEGETVEVGSVVALVGAEGASVASSPKSQTPSQDSAAAPVAEVPQSAPVQAKAASAASGGNGVGNGSPTVDELRRTKSSPLVRSIA